MPRGQALLKVHPEFEGQHCSIALGVFFVLTHVAFKHRFARSYNRALEVLAFLALPT